MEPSNGSATNHQLRSWIIQTADRYLQIVELVNLVGLCGIVTLFGIMANILNLIVFYRQGFNTTINISFFALAMSDLSCLLLQQWHVVITFWQFSELPIMFSEFQYATAAWPHETFTRVTFSITVYITVERSLCITFPLTIKKIITLKRTSAIIICIYIATLSSWGPLYASSNIDWKFFPDRNRSLLGLVFTNHEHMFAAVTITHAFFGVISIPIVVLATIILICQMKAKSAWRKSANVQQKNSDSLSSRDRKTIVMVILIDTILIVCYTPSVLLCLITFCNLEFTIGGKYFSLYQVLWSFAYVLENVNSSVNIFLYITMSSRYKSTFNTISKEWRNACLQPKS